MAARAPMLKRVHPLAANSALEILLSPVGYLYETVFRLWLSLYQHKLLKSRSLGVPVISIGNITVGGTGKTPFTQYLASYLNNRGMKVAILSRGYGREGRGGWALVSDGERTYHDPKEIGDEPFLLASNLQGIPVVVGRDRFRAGRYAIREFHCDVLVLDDGFQHLPLRRDLDIALLDSTNPFGNYKAIPAGILREPLRGLSRAGLLVLTRVDQGRQVAELRQFLKEVCPHAPVIEAVHKPLEILPLPGGQPEGLEFLKGKRVIALSSLGNPASFEKTLKDLGSFLVRRIRYPDHYPYSPRDLDWIERIFSDLSTDLIVTTEKDGVRLKGVEPSLPIFALRVAIQVVRGEHTLKKSLELTLRPPT